MASKRATFASRVPSTIDTRLLRRQGERCISIANASFDVQLRERQLELAARYIGRAVELEGLSGASRPRGERRSAASN